MDLKHQDQFVLDSIRWFFHLKTLFWWLNTYWYFLGMGGLLRRCFFRLLIRFRSNRRSVDAFVGRVFLRFLGGWRAWRTKAASLSLADLRFLSCDRCSLDSMIKTFSFVIWLCASFFKRLFTLLGNEVACSISNRSWTAVATLLTFWPPGPEEVTNFSSTSLSGMAKVFVTRIIHAALKIGVNAKGKFPASTRYYTGRDAPRKPLWFRTSGQSQNWYLSRIE